MRSNLNIDRFKAHFGPEPRIVKDILHDLKEEFGSNIVCMGCYDGHELDEALYVSNFSLCHTCFFVKLPLLLCFQMTWSMF